MNIETCSNTNTNGYKWIPFFLTYSYIQVPLNYLNRE